MFQQFFAVSCGRKKARWRKSKNMDRSRHTVTKYLSDEKTHAAINSKLFKKLDHLNNSLYEIELAKSEIEHKEPIIVGFFILQYAKLRMLELY